MDSERIRADILSLAQRGLIDEVRFIDAEPLSDFHLGDASRFSGRQPRDILPGARAVILFTVYIGAFVTRSDAPSGRMSRLVLSGFYSNIVRPLEPIREYLGSLGFAAAVIDGETDEASIPLKGAAVKAGLGWIGKNSLLISEKYGSFRALGAIVTDANIALSNPAPENHCGACTRCMDACPTRAISTPRLLERRNCLSNFMDGEAPGPNIPPSPDTQGYFFECDICQNACPWNRQHLFAPLDTPFSRCFDAAALSPLFTVERLRAMDEAEYERTLAPLMLGYRLPYSVFRRNLGFLPV